MSVGEYASDPNYTTGLPGRILLQHVVASCGTFAVIALAERQLSGGVEPCRRRYRCDDRRC